MHRVVQSSHNRAKMSKLTITSKRTTGNSYMLRLASFSPGLLTIKKSSYYANPGTKEELLELSAVFLVLFSFLPVWTAFNRII